MCNLKTHEMEFKAQEEQERQRKKSVALPVVQMMTKSLMKKKSCP